MIPLWLRRARHQLLNSDNGEETGAIVHVTNPRGEANAELVVKPVREPTIPVSGGGGHIWDVTKTGATVHVTNPRGKANEELVVEPVGEPTIPVLSGGGYRGMLIRQHTQEGAGSIKFPRDCGILYYNTVLHSFSAVTVSTVPSRHRQVHLGRTDGSDCY